MNLLLSNSNDLQHPPFYLKPTDQEQGDAKFNMN